MINRIPIVPILLVVNTGAIVFGLTLLLTRGEPTRELAVRLESAGGQVSSPEVSTKPSAVVPNTSWPLAEELRLSGKSAAALLQYAALREDESDTAVCSLLSLRQGQCLIDLGRLDQARSHFEVAGESPSATVRALARFHVAQMDAAGRLGLQARMHAYKALATDAAHWPAGMEQACDVIVARSLVDQGLMLCNSSDSVGGRVPSFADPFADKLSEEIYKALKASSSPRKPGILEDPIRQLKVSQAGRFLIRCDGAPLEDFLGRLATAANIRLRWHEAITPDVRRRRVSLCAEFPSSLRAAEIACGQAALLARFTGEEVIVYDPASCETEAQRRELICQEALSSWRRLLFRTPAAKTAALGHLQIGMLYEAMGQIAMALSEYRYIPQAYPHQSVSAEALLRCGKLRMDLKDFSGAHVDLLAMLDCFPDHPEKGNVYRYLAECELRTGKAKRAAQLYMRLYDLGISVKSRQTASLGAGQCLYSLGSYAEGASWVERYLAGPSTSDSATVEAQILLAQCRSALGQTEKAVRGLQRALAGDIVGSGRTELMLMLGETLSSGSQCGRALVVMGNIDKDRLSPDLRFRYVITSAKWLNRSGLADKAVRLLRSELDETTDPVRFARLQVALARCRESTGHLEEARQLLVASVGKLPPGPEARRAVCLLAEVCLRGGHHDQAMAVSKQLVQATEPDIRSRANALLAETHLVRKEYRLAAASLKAAGLTEGTDK